MSAVFDRPDAFAYRPAAKVREVGRRAFTPRYVHVVSSTPDEILQKAAAS